jgi:hypothetical protein
MNKKNVKSIYFAALLIITSISIYADEKKDIVPIEKIIHPKTSLEGNYPIFSSGLYAKNKWFWIDNNKIIFSIYEKSTGNRSTVESYINRVLSPKSYYETLHEMIKIWNIESGEVTNHKVGRVVCFEKNILRRRVWENKAVEPTYWIGSLSYDQLDENQQAFSEGCNQKYTSSVEKYIEEHPDELVQPLNQEDGFLVLGKREWKKIGNTYRWAELIPNDHIDFHPVGKNEVHLALYNYAESNMPYGPSYYPFAKTYLFSSNKAKGKKSTSRSESYYDNIMPNDYIPSIYTLSVDGDLIKIKVPDEFLNNYGFSNVYLSRRGILWTKSPISEGKAGIFLSRDETVIKISSDAVEAGEISPDGCKFSYLHRERTQLEGELKVIDLCQGIL